MHRLTRLFAVITLALVMVAPLPALAFDPFYDDNGSVHESDINYMWANKIAMGYGEGRYGPDDNVTRGQIASFLRRVLHTQNAERDYFNDDENSVHENDINAMYEDGVVYGCTGVERGDKGEYCPDMDVTRGEMAQFIFNTGLLPLVIPAEPTFSDVPRGSAYYQAVESLHAAKIAFGYGDGETFGPNDSMTRGQMASFLRRFMDRIGWSN